MSTSNDLTGVNPYTVLGVPKDATPVQIKKAYRRLSKKLHPDVGGNEAEFATLSLCYEALMDEEKRAYYDRTGEFRQQGSIDKEAAALLASLFSKAVTTYGNRVMERDLIGDLNKAIKEAFYAGRQRMEKSKKLIALWEKLATQIIKKKEGPPVFEQVIDQNIQGFNRDIADCEHAIAIGERALELLDMYGFDVVVPPPPNQFIGSGFGVNSDKFMQDLTKQSHGAFGNW